MFIIFALSIKPKGYEKTKQGTKGVRSRANLLLRLYSELKGREGAAKILASIEEEINKLVEILKEL